ncbi:MAG TPA: hypothetical protein VGH23_01845 [Rhizomicrobium sp.]|jgi:hypothetical protein
MKFAVAAVLGAGLLFLGDATAEVDRSAVVRGTQVLAPMALNSYSRFPHNIGSAPVYDLDAHRVGQVKALNADAAGKPASMEIWLPSGLTFTVPASNIGYDEQQNIVTAGLTDTQLGLARPAGR